MRSGPCCALFTFRVDSASPAGRFRPRFVPSPAMAAPAGDGALKPLQRAMKLANRAIQLDTGNLHREAYVEYLKSVSYISQFLLEDAEQKDGRDTVSADSQKMLKLAEQCLERARSTAGKLDRAESDLLSRTPCISDPGPPTTEITCAAAVTSATSGFSPSRPWGHRRTCSDEAQTLCPFPPPEIFQKLRAADAQRSKKELTPLEEASIQNQKLRATYEVRLARLNPNQATQKTSLTLSLQRQMMENLVIAKAREETLQRKTEERRLRLKEESKRRFSSSAETTPEQEEQRLLYTSVLEYEQDHDWPKLWKLKLKGRPDDPGAVSSFMCQILSSPDHPISILLRRLQCQIYSRLYPIISKDPADLGKPSALCPLSLPIEGLLLPAYGSQRLKSSQSLHCLPSASRPPLRHSLSTGEGPEAWGGSGDTRGDGRESSFEDLEKFLSPTEIPSAKATWRLPEQLKVTVKEIHNTRDTLLSLSLLALDLPSSSPCKDQCLECLEESFFPPLWPPLLALYRRVLSAREDSLLRTMELYRNAPPSVVGVPRKLYPREVGCPYRAAMEELGLLSLQTGPQKKLECIVRTLRVICECAEEYCTKPGASVIGADDLLPILAFVVLRSGLSQLLSECAALEEFIHDGYLIGEEGYCLTSLQSALSYLETMHRGSQLP
ncbi:VPS9 domain-containing protein 1 [Ascaphus truei]|uniref:VPS9 domain-containing protein 1 n=1 Tax=Ascaphus truei TaxID=8439 RepID=UPI003F591991